MKINLRVKLIAACIFLLNFSSCTFNNEEDLYPDSECNVESAKFGADIVPIINRHCIGCHNDFARQGNISLQSHAEVVSYVQNGSFLGSIKHESGWSPMPKGTPMIQDCDIRKIEEWINSGSPNN